MSDSQISAQHIRSAPLLPARIENAVEDVVGVAAVSSVAAADRFVRWVTITDAWILFFLWTKPLWDLGWRWKFFRILDQDVNIQASVALVVLILNLTAMLHRSAWHRLPRRVLVFLVLAIFSVCLTFSSEGVNEIIRLLAGASFFYTAGPFLATERHFNLFSKLFLWATSVPVVLCFFQVAGILPYDYWDWTEVGKIGRASGTYQHPLDLIYFLMIAFPLALTIAHERSESRMAKRWAWVFLVLASVALAFTYHRTSYFIVVLQVLIFFWVKRRWKTVLGFGAVLALIIFLFSGWIEMLYAPLTQSLSGNDAGSGEFFRGRGFQWFLFLDSYASAGPFHWVLGLGGSQIAGIDPNDPTIDSTEPHNDFIRVLHAYGVVGLLLYISVLALFVRRATQLLYSRDEFASSLALVMLLILTAVFVLSMMAEPLRYPAGAWYLFAIGSALFCVRERSKSALRKAIG